MGSAPQERKWLWSVKLDYSIPLSLQLGLLCLPCFDGDFLLALECCHLDLQQRNEHGLGLAFTLSHEGDRANDLHCLKPSRILLSAHMFDLFVAYRLSDCFCLEPESFDCLCQRFLP